MSADRFARLVEDRVLEEIAAEDEEIEGHWRIVVREARDSRAPDLSLAGTFTHAYHAALQACTIVLRARGYRLRKSQGGHHYHTFYAVAALGLGRVSELADDAQELRANRHAALYDWRESVEEEDALRMREVAVELAQAVHQWLAGERPGLRLARP